MAGAKEERLAHLPETEEAAGALRLGEADAVFILYDVYTIDLANRVKEQVKELMKKEGSRG